MTDAVLDDVKAWQGRPLEAVYPIVYLDAIHVKMRTAGHVQTQAVYLAGEKELLGLWVGEAEGAKFWLSVLTELKNRGVQDMLSGACDPSQPRAVPHSECIPPVVLLQNLPT